MVSNKQRPEDLAAEQPLLDEMDSEKGAIRDAPPAYVKRSIRQRIRQHIIDHFQSDEAKEARKAMRAMALYIWLPATVLLFLAVYMDTIDIGFIGLDVAIYCWAAAFYLPLVAHASYREFKKWGYKSKEPYISIGLCCLFIIYYIAVSLKAEEPSAHAGTIEKLRYDVYEFMGPSPEPYIQALKITAPMLVAWLNSARISGFRNKKIHALYLTMTIWTFLALFYLGAIDKRAKLEATEN